MTEGTVELRWREKIIGTARVKLVLEYRTRSYNVLGKLMEWSSWVEVPRVVEDEEARQGSE